MILGFQQCQSIKGDPKLLQLALNGGLTEKDFPLSERGVKQGRPLIKAVYDKVFRIHMRGKVKIYRSPYESTVQTSEFIVKALCKLARVNIITGLDVINDERLVNQGDGESNSALYERVRSFYSDLLRETDHVILVTSFEVMVYLIALTEGYSSEEYFYQRVGEFQAAYEGRDPAGSMTVFNRDEGESEFILVSSFQKLA